MPLKTPNTLLVERAMKKHEMPEDPLAHYRASAVEQLGPTVIDATMGFWRPFFAAQRVAGTPQFGGMLVRFLLRRYQRRLAGGLPQHFLLAVTEDEVVALQRTMKMRTRDGIGEVGPEVARWRRDEITVETADKGWMLNVTLTAPTGVTSVQCGVARVPATEALLAGLATS